MAAEDIKQLTPEQLALIPIIRDEWIKICLDTTPIDKQKAKAAICLAYECAQLEPPKEILWFDNPLDAANYVPSTYALADIVPDAIIDASGDIVWDIVGDAVKDAVKDAVWNIAGNPVWGNTVNHNFYDPLVDAEWLASFAYFETINVDCSKVKGLFATAKHRGRWWAFTPSLSL